MFTKGTGWPIIHIDDHVYNDLGFVIDLYNMMYFFLHRDMIRLVDLGF